MSGNKVLELKNISKSFGTRKIIDKLTIFGCLVIFLLLTLIASKYIEIFLK